MVNAQTVTLFDTKAAHRQPPVHARYCPFHAVGFVASQNRLWQSVLRLARNKPAKKHPPTVKSNPENDSCVTTHPVAVSDVKIAQECNQQWSDQKECSDAGLDTTVTE